MLEFWPMFEGRTGGRDLKRGVVPAGDDGTASEAASQRALDAIRSGGDRRLVLVQGYEWAGAQRWPANHPTARISDPADNFRYEAHHYWDRDNSGAYSNGYAAEVDNAQQRGF